MNFNNYTIKAQEAIQKATEIAGGFQQQAIETGHILKAILETDENVTNFLLQKLTINGNILHTKLDEIVAFAEIGKFLDTPVKHYSSGMYVRLAFSVAAHLEPEILLVDEVLAVGDVAFQRKCLGKMDDVARAGRTVVFLDEGRIARYGSMTEAVDSYLQTLEHVRSQDLSVRRDRKGVGMARLLGAEVEAMGNELTSVVRAGCPARFRFTVSATVPGIACNFFIYDSIGQPVASFMGRVRGPEDTFDVRSSHAFVCELDELLLLPGRYRLDVAVVGDNALQDFIEAATVFEVSDGQIRGRQVQPDGKFSIGMPHRWILPAKA